MHKRPIILTRPLYEADNIRQSLEAEGWEVIAFPMIEIKALELNEADSLILKNCKDFPQIVFTSKNGVHEFFRQKGSFPKEDLTNSRFACIGKTTAKALGEYGNNASLIAEGSSEDFLPLLKSDFIQPNENLLLVQGKLADNFLLNELNALCPTSRLQIYDTLAVQSYSKEVVERIRNNDYSLLLFTSPSAFHRFIEIMKECEVEKDFRIACIGNTTAKAVRESGIEPIFVAGKSRGEDMVKELKEHLRI